MANRQQKKIKGGGNKAKLTAKEKKQKKKDKTQEARTKSTVTPVT